MAVFASDHVLYQGNKVSRNGGNGINIADSTSTILDNRLKKNGLDGLRVEESLPSAIPNWLIGDNRATHNGGHGLNVLTPAFRTAAATAPRQRTRSAVREHRLLDRRRLTPLGPPPQPAEAANGSPMPVVR